MKIACQEAIVPGESFREKVDNLVALGFEGVELTAPTTPEGSGALAARADEVLDALRGAPLAVSSICGGQPMMFLAADVELRKAAIEGFKRTLKVAGEPIFGPPQLSDPWPLKSVVELEKEMLARICAELAKAAAENNTNVLLEPLNRYETHLLRTLADALEILDMAGNPPGLKIMADFFHMNIEESDIAAHAAGTRLGSHGLHAGAEGAQRDRLPGLHGVRMRPEPGRTDGGSASRRRAPAGHPRSALIDARRVPHHMRAEGVLVSARILHQEAAFCAGMRRFCRTPWGFVSP